MQPPSHYCTQWGELSAVSGFLSSQLCSYLPLNDNTNICHFLTQCVGYYGVHYQVFNYISVIYVHFVNHGNQTGWFSARVSASGFWVRITANARIVAVISHQSPWKLVRQSTIIIRGRTGMFCFRIMWQGHILIQPSC